MPQLFLRKTEFIKENNLTSKSKVIFVSKNLIFYGYSGNENNIYLFIQDDRIKSKSFNANIHLPSGKSVKM